MRQTYRSGAGDETLQRKPSLTSTPTPGEEICAGLKFIISFGCAEISQTGIITDVGGVTMAT